MRLRRIDRSDPGFARRRRGRGFTYVDPLGRRVTDRAVLDRIRGLAIPPAWTDVWICMDPRGHLQAVGTDSARRTQYLYHPGWRERRDQAKFDRMLRFARALPRLRRVVAADLGQPAYSRERVLACAVRLLDLGFFRIGSETYADSNDTFGLATMRKRHASVAGTTVTFDYRAKGGKRTLQEVVDPDVANLVKALKRRRGKGSELLAYRNGAGWRDVRSSDINEYIQRVAGEEFTAKDFRTWNATLLAAVALSTSASTATSKTSRRRLVGAVVKEVADYLGNTPAVCRAAYIDPRVFDRFEAGAAIAKPLNTLRRTNGGLMPQRRKAVERAVLNALADTGDREAA
jgi:DNA topoisomerase-1